MNDRHIIARNSGVVVREDDALRMMLGIPAATVPHFRPDDNCVEFLYMNGVLTEMCSDATFAQAMSRSPEGRWYPIDHGYRSEDGRTLLLHRNLSRPPLTEIAKRLKAGHA